LCGGWNENSSCSLIDLNIWFLERFEDVALLEEIRSTKAPSNCSSTMPACHNAPLHDGKDSPSQTISKPPIKYFLLKFILLMVSHYGHRKVTETTCLDSGASHRTRTQDPVTCQ
ncbi:mCG145299, partial [Mus musculus]